MKHLLLSLALLLAFVGQALAAKKGDKFGVDFNTKDTFHGSATADYFSYGTGKHNFSQKSKYGTCVYTVCGDEIEFTDALKMEGSTLVQYSAAAENTLTVVMALYSNGKGTFSVDGAAVTFEATENGTLTIGENSYSYKATKGDNYMEFVIEGLPIGTHSIMRSGSENGLWAVVVEYTSDPKIVLDKPSIEADEETGVVTVGTVEHASKIAYEFVTADKQDTIQADYVEPITLTTDGTVTAWAVGEGDYADSQKASVTVALFNAKLDAPTFVQQNGTIGMTTSQIKTSIEYSIDNGENWSEYVYGLTFEENGVKVLARALRTNGDKTNYSEVAEVEINSVVAKPEGTKRILLTCPENQSTDSEENELEVKVAGQTFKMTITGDDKWWSAGKKIVLPGEGENVTWKDSKGRQNMVTLPDGLKAKRATFYSYANNGAKNAYFAEVNGETLSAIYMGASTETLDNPDVRVFDLGEEGVGSFTFKGANDQLCFVLALDVTGLEAAEYKISVAEVEGGKALVNAAAYAGDPVSVKLVPNEGFAIDTVEISGVDKLTWGRDSQNKISKKTATFIMPSADVVVTPVFKSTAEPSSIRSLATDAEDAKTFNLQGVKVDASYKGLVIRGGKKFLQK